MLQLYPYVPTVATEGSPTGLQWLHELKYDGFRLIVQRFASR